MALALAVVQSASTVRSLTWSDLTPFHSVLQTRGITSSSLPAYLERTREQNARRVREGDLDHLVFYLLQSTQFTKLPPIEPALSAKALVEGLSPDERKQFLIDPFTAGARVPAEVRSRIAALLRRLEKPSDDPRLTYFRTLVNTAFPDPRGKSALLAVEYLRTMRFVYEKEFVAQRSASAREKVTELYRTRGLSTDTAIEAGYLVYLGLGVLKSLEPNRRIRRVLIVGPGLDLAPRTALLEEGPPQSYQPWAVIDALLALDLSRTDDLTVVGADINPRVVTHLQRSGSDPPELTLVTGIADDEMVTLTEEYRDYFTRLGNAIGDTRSPSGSGAAKGHLRKSVKVRPSAARTLQAQRLDIVTQRLGAAPFDLVIATNILPYFDDVQLMLALSNVAAMLAPGGVFLHNEARPLVGEVTAALNLPFQQSRHGTIATVRGAPPLGDSVWIHKRIAHP
jgi:hypothetical protein